MDRCTPSVRGHRRKQGQVIVLELVTLCWLSGSGHPGQGGQHEAPAVGSSQERRLEEAEPELRYRPLGLSAPAFQVRGFAAHDFTLRFIGYNAELPHLELVEYDRESGSLSRSISNDSKSASLEGAIFAFDKKARSWRYIVQTDSPGVVQFGAIGDRGRIRTLWEQELSHTAPMCQVLDDGRILLLGEDREPPFSLHFSVVSPTGAIEHDLRLEGPDDLAASSFCCDGDELFVQMAH